MAAVPCKNDIWEEFVVKLFRNLLLYTLNTEYLIIPKQKYACIFVYAEIVNDTL